MSYQFGYSWPPGTCSVLDLPVDILASLLHDIGYSALSFVTNVNLPIQESATEGNFVTYAGYKIRVTINPLGEVKFA